MISACLTGSVGGIGQDISELLECEVIAPDDGSNLKSITADISNDRPVFSVEYFGAHPKKYSSGVEVFDKESIVKIKDGHTPSSPVE